MTFSTICKTAFTKAILDYHLTDDVNQNINNPYESGSIEFLMYQKSWIDTVQWHLEDIIRDTNIDPVTALQIKRRIDKSNQDRTDLVEQIDERIIRENAHVEALPNATINTESPAWAIDRLSILQLKIFHWEIEAERNNVAINHISNAKSKLAILYEQQNDLSLSIDELLNDIAAGKKIMKAYRQMKMYNDPALNPVLYSQKKP